MKHYRYGLDLGRRCPICDFSGEGFAPFGDPTRQDARCPRCGGLERHRLLWLYLQRETAVCDGGRGILYIAPREELSMKIGEGNAVVTTDRRAAGVDVRADLTRLPFDCDVFDVAICSHVLEHVPDDRAAMSELYRVLGPGGRALLMVPKDKGREHTYEDDTIDSPGARTREFGQRNHVRWYGRDFPTRLSDIGFDVSVHTYADSLDPNEVKGFGLDVYPPAHGSDTYADRVKHEDIHVAEVPAGRR